MLFNDGNSAIRSRGWILLHTDLDKAKPNVLGSILFMLGRIKCTRGNSGNSLVIKISNRLLSAYQDINESLTNYIQSNLRERPPLHNGHLSTTATTTNGCPQLPKSPLNNGQFFQRLMKKSRMVTNWSVWHVYNQSWQSYFDFVSFIQLKNYEPCLFCHISILIHDIIQASYAFYLYTVYMIGLPRLWDTVSMNLAQKKHITPQLPHNGHLSTMATFFCPH